MKIRTDYVTNSSSSSFILAFQDKEDFKLFEEDANYSDYEEFVELIHDLMKDEDNLSKDKALDLLYFGYSRDIKEVYSDEKIKKKDNESFIEHLRRKNAFEKSDECNRYVDEQLKGTDYAEKKNQIEKAEIVVTGTIWDTSGGILEWSIRNGFIEDCFGKNHVFTWNVG